MVTAEAPRQRVEKHNASGTPISVGYSHGPGGNLSYPGVDPAIFHTVAGSIGIAGQLPATPSVYNNPTYEIITGVLGDTGTDPAGACDDAPVAGLSKGCITTSVFGNYRRRTPEINLTRIGKFNDRADPMDLQLIGSPLEQAGLFATGPGGVGMDGNVLTNEAARKFWELAISLKRVLDLAIWRDSPSADVGENRHMTGLDVLVNTGYRDAQTGMFCPSVDSDLKDFNFERIDGAGDAIVNALTYIYYTRRDLALRTGVMPVRWVWAMRPELFYELTAIWPCAYLTYRCAVAGNAQLTIDSADQVAMRDEMRAGRYLLIDGEAIPVVLDDGIAFDTNTTNGNVTSGCMASDIYLLPMSILGGRSSLYLEYMDYGNPSLTSALATGITEAVVQGAWFVTRAIKNACVFWQAQIEPRLVLRTPQLAGRLTNVEYCPTQFTRSPFPGDPYFVNGGVTSRSGPSLFTPGK